MNIISHRINCRPAASIVVTLELIPCANYVDGQTFWSCIYLIPVHHCKLRPLNWYVWQCSICCTVPRSDLFGKYASSSIIPKYSPGHCDRVPTTCRMIVSTRHESRIKESWERNSKFRIDKKVCDSSDLSHLPAVSGKRTSGQYFYKCIVPTSWLVSTSDRSLSDMAVAATRL
jgi:hypothetical protein